MSLHQPNRRRLRQRWIALFLMIAIALAACAGDGGSADEVSTSPDMSQEVNEADTTSDPMAATLGDDTPDEDMTSESLADGEIAAPESPNAFGTDANGDRAAFPDGVLAEAVAIVIGRDIIKTGDVVLEAADVSATADDIIATVFANGGVIWGQETQTDPTPRAVLTIRVPPVDFERLLNALTRMDGVGVVSQSTTSDDVTEVVIDLDARITAAESSVTRVQELLDRATDLNEIFRLEEELATREGNLERLRGQRKTIGDQIALSSITVTVVELDPDRKSSAMEVIAWIGEDHDDACPGHSELDIGADDRAVLCVNISNTGDDVLTDIELQATPFRLRTDDFTIDQGIGTLDALEPGDDLIAFVELDAEGGFISRIDASSGLEIGVTVTATPVTTAESELSGSDIVFVSSEVEDELPGFSDSFSSGWNAMINVLSVLMIVVGILLPFVPLLILVVWLGRKFAAKSKARADARAAFTEAYVASTAPGTPDAPTLD